jgi:hypothetical protein
LEEFQQVSFFHLCTCVHRVYISKLLVKFTLFPYIHPPRPFPISSPFPPVLTCPPTLDLFRPPVLWFCIRKKKEEKWHFCLFKIATQGVSLWHFHIYMYYNPNMFIFIFLLSTLVHFLWWFQPV